MATNDAPQGGTPDDDGAQAAEQGTQPTPREQSTEPDRTFTQADVDRLIADRLDRERKKFADYNDLKARASKLQELEDAQKSETERLNDQLAAAQVELQTFRVAEIRRAAAAKAGLDPELAEFITAADEAEALNQAKKLAERVAPPAPPEPPRPDFRQGSRTPAVAQPNANDWIRQMSGRARG